MAWTQTDLDTLKAAYASGAVRVTLPDRTIEYRSIAELERAISRIENELNTNNGNQPIRQFRVFAKDGF